MSDVKRALEGIRVVDLTVWFQGPVAGQHLADFGAEVIHLERPQGGDLARGVRSIKAVPVGEWNQYFLVINRNKKSMALDLKLPEGQAVMRKLLAESDVFLTNLSRDNLASWNLSYDDVRAVNPKLIYAVNSGYGQHGDDSKPSFDMTVQALTGLMTRLGEPGQPPIYLGMGSGDAIGGLMAAWGILMALHQRRRTGKGQLINASLYGAQLLLGGRSLQGYLATGSQRFSRQRSRAEPDNALWNTYEASDAWLYLCLRDEGDAWDRVVATLDDDALARDGRFSAADSRRENAAALTAALDAVIASRPVGDWLAAWRATGIPCGRIGTLADLAADEQAWANEYFTETYCEEVQRNVTVRGMPVGLSETPGTVRSLGPELGQHTEEILVETLGYSWDDVIALKEAGAIL